MDSTILARTSGQIWARVRLKLVPFLELLSGPIPSPFPLILLNTLPPLASKVFPETPVGHFILTLLPALREAVANLYNHTYREGKASQYTYENVCIVPGGRSGLSRLAAVIGDVYTVSRRYHKRGQDLMFSTELPNPRLYCI